MNGANMRSSPPPPASKIHVRSAVTWISLGKGERERGIYCTYPVSAPCLLFSPQLLPKDTLIRVTQPGAVHYSEKCKSCTKKHQVM